MFSSIGNEAAGNDSEAKYNLMLSIHRRTIASEQVEIGTGREFGDPRRFPSLYNSLIWAYAKSASASLPSFTERVNVADLGIDAEWETQLPAEHDSRLLGPSWNVFQYKQHDVTAQGRGRAFSKFPAAEEPLEEDQQPEGVARRLVGRHFVASSLAGGRCPTLPRQLQICSYRSSEIP
jgi:hypothetical protein